MVKDGVAAESDFNAVEAERLAAVQQALELDSEKASLLRLLSMFTWKTVSEVVKPNEVETGASANRRPELRMIENQIKLTEVQEKALNVGLMPRLTAFAQGYYGYPGYDMFQGMRSRDWSLNGMVGVTLSWDIGALYTRKNDKSKFILQRQMSENQRDEFLFNISLEQVQQDDNIECYRQLLKTDDDIVLLRQKVRKASESKLEHGIIDVNDLVKEINNENQALVQKSTHEIQLLQSVYDKKYINND
jgi:outer membrane protein TolC